MLFLDICEVSAATSWQTFEFSTVFYPNVSKDNTYGTVSGGAGYISNGTGSITSISGSNTTSSHTGYSYHVSVPFTFKFLSSDIGGTGVTANDQYNYFTIFPFFKLTSSVGTVSNLTLYYGDKIVHTENMGDSETYKIVIRGVDMRYGGDTDSQSYFRLPFTLEYDVAFQEFDSASSDLDEFTSTLKCSMRLVGNIATASDIKTAETQVSDAGTQQELSELNESTDAIEESVTSDTGGGLLATIKSWFGSFFDNLIHVFVPEDGYFTEWFNRLNSLLADKLGMLYAPFDLLITTLQAIYDTNSNEPGIPFPGIKWEDTWLVEPTTFYFSSLGDSEGIIKLRDTVYFGTDVVLLFSFLFLLERKIKHILED